MSQGVVILSKPIGELQEPSQENVAFIIDQMNKKLQVVNTGMIRSEDIDLSRYEDLLDLYDYIMTKDNYSTSETQMIVSELGQLRKK